MNFKRIVFFTSLLMLLTGSLRAKSLAMEAGPDTAPRLIVGVAGSPPFVVTDDPDAGISLEIWQLVATEIDQPFETRSFADVPAALKALDSGLIDVVAGPVSITSEREHYLRFSQPYYQSSLSILSRSERPGLWERIRPFFSWKFFTAVGVFVFILSLVGLLIWLAERRKNPEQFGGNIRRGVGNGMWCAIVTMTTTGYGDKAPASFYGRLITACWMIVSILFATSMVAGIASTLTLSGLSESTITVVEELRDRKVAVVSGSPGALFVSRHAGLPVSVPSLEEGYSLLKSKKVDAVVFDRPQMLYFLKQRNDENVMLSKAEYAKKGYGFAFASDTQLIHEVNIALLQLQESGRVTRILEYWIKESD